ncbi:TatD family hydrolase [Parendozoicomonas haliclonae]|uniref:Putative deoxyribonuclease YcfH n=1 Tax=Parendozoicomonas haliclonae TaxID=1960125 RepID=A0A1X7AMJ9_9GAMM|nr:TatD family hydrolase [Parendozoicomonas haliclonae]SMA49149.1 putative deoxyribonuclease YcfH [Parendozoicomonas haliclonae]
MFIDSHCHLDRLDLTPYDGDVQAAIRAARQAGVDGILCVCIDMENFPAVLKLAEQDNIWASVGVHPLENKAREATADELLAMARHDKVVAIGEAGLDYFYAKERKDVMLSRFVTQLEVSKASGLPVIVHTRDARQDTLDLLKAHASPEAAGVLHCFTESWDMAKAAMDLGFYISFSGIVTFRNAEALREVAKKMPLDRMLIETDSPYLAPVPHRGKSNEPQFVADVARFLAELKGVSVEELAQTTTDNFFRLFPKAQLVK